MLNYGCFIKTMRNVSKIIGYRGIFLVLLIFSVFILRLDRLRNGHSKSDMAYCFLEGDSPSPHESDGSTLQRLEDVFEAETKPTPGRTIFFLETTCHRSRENAEHRAVAKLSVRQACSIESAARYNPNFDIFVLFASPVYLNSAVNDSIIESILSYKNVRLRNLNLSTYTAGTPVENWLKGGQLFRSKHVFAHTSDFLRLVTLWRWGGTYMDLDTITLHTMEMIPMNYVGAESNKLLNSAVMNFAPTGFGHDIVEQCIDDFQQNFDGSQWEYNGPGVITRVLKRLCNTEDLMSMVAQKGRCLGFQVFGTDAFYAVPWTEWPRYFEENQLKEVMNITKNAYLVHMWNNFSKTRRVKKGSDEPYSVLAEKHCPKVYATAEEYF